MVQHYFATAWVPPKALFAATKPCDLSNNLYAIRSIESVGTIAPGPNIRLSKRDLWVGPQDQKAMSALAPGLELVVDYGWLTIISKPLFKLMTWLHQHAGQLGLDNCRPDAC